MSSLGRPSTTVDTVQNNVNVVQSSVQVVQSSVQVVQQETIDNKEYFETLIGQQGVTRDEEGEVTQQHSVQENLETLYNMITGVAAVTGQEEIAGPLIAFKEIYDDFDYAYQEGDSIFDSIKKFKEYVGHPEKLPVLEERDEDGNVIIEFQDGVDARGLFQIYNMLYLKDDENEQTNKNLYLDNKHAGEIRIQTANALNNNDEGLYYNTKINDKGHLCYYHNTDAISIAPWTAIMVGAGENPLPTSGFYDLDSSFKACCINIALNTVGINILFAKLNALKISDTVEKTGTGIWDALQGGYDTIKSSLAVIGGIGGGAIAGHLSALNILNQQKKANEYLEDELRKIKEEIDNINNGNDRQDENEPYNEMSLVDLEYIQQQIELQLLDGYALQQEYDIAYQKQNNFLHNDYLTNSKFQLTDSPDGNNKTLISPNLDFLEQNVGTLQDNKETDTIYGKIAKNVYDIDNIENTIGTPQDNKDTATIYGNIAKNVYDIDNLENNVFYKDFITNFSDSKFQLSPVYDENNNIINYKLESTLLDNVRDALGSRAPSDNTESAFEKIAANKTDIETNTTDIQTNKDDIVDLRTDLTTQTGRIDDMRLVLGYDDNSILHLILPLNEIGETPSIEANLINNNGVLDLGYKKNDLVNNFDDYFNLFFAIPKLHSEQTITTFTENQILNGILPTNANITFVTDYQNLKSYMSGTLNFEITNNNLCISLFVKLSQLTEFKNFLSYNGINVSFKNNTLKINYNKEILTSYTILDNTFANNATYTDLNYYDNRYTYHISKTDHNLINYIEILDNENNDYGDGIDIFTTTSIRGYKLTNEVDSVEIYFKHDVVIKNIDLVLKRFWTYGSGFTQTPFEVFAKLNIYIRDSINDPWVQILQNDYKALGYSQYQGVTSFNITDENQTLSCRFLSISFQYNAPPLQPSHSELEICYLSIPDTHILSEYTNDESVLPIQSNNEYSHIVYNHSQNNKTFNFIIDGITRDFNLTDYFELNANQLVIGDQDLQFRMLGIGNTYHTNLEIIQDIKNLNDTSLRVNIDGLTKVDDLFVKDNLLVNKLEFINGNEIISFAPSIEETSGRRRALISDTTYTLLDEVIIPNAPTENAFLYYDTTTANINTRSDVVLDSDLTAYQLKVDAFDGDYNNLNNLPVLFDGDYNNLNNKPTLFDGNYTNLTNKPDLFSGNYTDLSNKPELFDGNYTNLTNKPTLFDGNYNNLNNLPDLFDGNYNNLTNRPDLFDGNYNNLTNRPDLFSGNYTDLANIPNLSIYSLNSELNTKITDTSNYVYETNNSLSSRITNLSYTELKDLPAIYSYALKTELNTEITHTSNYVYEINNSLSSRINNLSYTELNDIPNLSIYSLNSELDTELANTSNYVSQTSNLISSRINNLSIGDINLLQSALDGKATTTHTHLAEDITDLQDKLDLYILNTDFNQDIKDLLKNGNYNENVKINRGLEIEPATAGKAGFYFYDGILSLSTQPRIYIDANNDIILCDNYLTRDGKTEDTRIQEKLISLLGINLNYNLDTLKIDAVPTDISGSYYDKSFIDSNFYKVSVMNNIYYNKSYIDNNFYTTTQINSQFQGYDIAIQNISDNVDALSSGNSGIDVITFFDETMNAFEYTITGTINRRSSATLTGTTEIDNTGTSATQSYIIFENAIQVKEIIFTDDETFKFKSKAELIDLISPNITQYTDQDVRDFLATPSGTIDHINIPNLLVATSGLPTFYLQKLDENDNILSNALIYISTLEEGVKSLNIDIGSTIEGETEKINFRLHGNDKFFVENNLTTFNTSIKIIPEIDNNKYLFTQYNINNTDLLYENYLLNYPNNNADNLPNNIIHFQSYYADTGFWFGTNDGSQDLQWLHINDFALSTDRNLTFSKRPNSANNDVGIVFSDGSTLTTSEFLLTNQKINTNTLEVDNEGNLNVITDINNFKNGDDLIQIGNGNINKIPTIRIIGTNTEPISSRIVFADDKSNNPDYYQGMVIYYDSSLNNLNISGDNDVNNVIDTPPNITFTRQTRYTGIQNTNPQYQLDVTGDVNCTGKYYTNGVSLNNLINDNSTNITTNTSDIASLDTRITTQENNLNTTNTNVGTNTTDISTLQSSLDTTNTNVANNASGIANNLSNVTAALAQIAALTSTVNTNTTNISTNTSDIAALDLRLTTEENKDHFVNGDEILTLGTASSSEVPTINLIGANYKPISSKIVFSDNNASGELNNGMIIYYDSSFNTLNISADENVDNIIDTPPAITIKRQNRYVGIHNTSPQYMLDVSGDVNTTGNYYTNGISLNNLVNDNSADITALDTRLTTQENRAFFPIHPSIGYDETAPDNTIYIRNISGTGYVGINKTDPLLPLDVAGTIRGNSLNSITGISAANLNMNSDSVDAIMRINASEPGNAIIKLATPFYGSFANKSNVALQAIGRSSWGKSDFVIGVSNVNNNSTTYEPLDTYYQRMRIPCDSFTQFFGTYGSGSLGAYYYGYGATGSFYTMSWSVCTKHNGVIWATSYFINSSDRDIKKDIEELKDDECLQKILLLKPSKYRYVDETKNITPNKTYGYIAQEVAEVLPEAVRYQAEYIPNALCFVNINNDIITIDSVRPDTFKIVLSVGLKIKLFDDNDNEILAEIKEVIDENTFKVNEELNFNKLFLYGSLKEDFNVLAKEYINAVHVSATQELHRIITKQQEEINELKEKLNNVLIHLGL